MHPQAYAQMYAYLRTKMQINYYLGTLLSRIVVQWQPIHKWSTYAQLLRKRLIAALCQSRRMHSSFPPVVSQRKTTQGSKRWTVSPKQARMAV